MPNAFFQLFFFIHRLSIDIALGAAAVLLGLSSALLLAIPWYYYVLLINGTFIIYWIDHIQDSQKALLVQAGARHAIFKKYRWVFMLGIALLAVCNALLVYLFLPIPAVLLGMLLLAILLAYLRFHRQLKRVFVLEKEVLIAILYTLSTGFAALVLFASPYATDWLVLACLLFSIFCSCLQNLFSSARIEAYADAQAGIRNISHLFGSVRLKLLQELFLCLQALLVFTFFILFQQPALLRFSSLLLLIAAGNYALPYFYSDTQDPSYRWIGDGVFLLLFLCAL